MIYETGYVNTWAGRIMSDKYYSQIILIATAILSVCTPSQCLHDNNFVCEKVNTCQCVSLGGKGIDLTDLEKVAKSPWLQATGKDLTFFFQPCTNILPPYPADNECAVPGAALCVYNSTLKTYKLLGKVTEATFDSKSINDPIPVFLKYNFNGILTTIGLECGAEADPTSLVFNAAQSTNTSYVLTLKSPTTCLKIMDIDDHSLSTGSVLVILFFTFSAIYFAGGALAMKLVRGAEGKELIPNYDFWSGLPLLVKDGALFALSGFQSIPSYDRI